MSMPSSSNTKNTAISTEHYESAEHRRDGTKFEQVQKGNAEWWTDHTMSYDWSSRIEHVKYSLDWFDEIDRRFVNDSRLYGHDKSPFDLMIPFEKLKGKKVLEIGCGMGFHTELFIRAGAVVHSIDISSTSVESTQKRLALKGLSATVIQQDAESLSFADQEFDYVWSWGVIHHSSRTARIVRQISRVLKPSGECALMVYNRDGASAWRSIIKYHLLALGCVAWSFK
jgi:2-polyprenyl-3-methyl-5-hydroxy-6-metoxy-1,4-benzoquinol methylase